MINPSQKNNWKLILCWHYTWLTWCLMCRKLLTCVLQMGQTLVGLHPHDLTSIDAEHICLSTREHDGVLTGRAGLCNRPHHAFLLALVCNVGWQHCCRFHRCRLVHNLAGCCRQTLFQELNLRLLGPFSGIAHKCIRCFSFLCLCSPEKNGLNRYDDGIEVISVGC